ncbi:MAG: DUF5666 domain-containing protein [Rubrivivax sp.]|nr:DUF5666 domain-containing protein [Rubrivivax sp.]
MCIKTSIASLAAAVLLSALPGCGGGGGGSEPAATQTAVGTITSFGSVVVNGVRFDDSAARVTINDATASRDQLRVGMMVQVQGQIRRDGSGVAETIRYQRCMQGPVTAMNRVRNELTVLGQTVEVDDDTVFDGVALQDMNAFAIGDLVQVSCQVDPAHQRVRATLMERMGAFQNGRSELEMQGTVADLDKGAGTFKIDGLTVNFAAMAAADVPAGLTDGMTVSATGKSYDGSTFTADRLRDRDRDRISYPDGAGLELEGIVSDFVSIANFKVADQAVDGSSAVIKNGTAADVRDGLKVEVEGSISSGILVATRIVIRLQSDVQVEAGLQSKDSGQGTITLLGQSIKVTADTDLKDKLAHAGRPTVIDLASLDVADRLRVAAYRDLAGDLVAKRVERTPADPLVVVKGPADAKAPVTQLTLAGFDVATGASSRYRDATGTLVDAATFYAALAVPPAAAPTVVHARGVVASLSTNVVDATRSISTIGELEIGGD